MFRTVSFVFRKTVVCTVVVRYVLPAKGRRVYEFLHTLVYCVRLFILMHEKSTIP